VRLGPQLITVIVDFCEIKFQHTKREMNHNFSRAGYGPFILSPDKSPEHTTLMTQPLSGFQADRQQPLKSHDDLSFPFSHQFGYIICDR
jgi:hypothetical protein